MSEEGVEAAEKLRSVGGVETRERGKTFGEISKGFVRRFHERIGGGTGSEVAQLCVYEYWALNI